MDNNIHLGISLDGDFTNKHRVDHGEENMESTIKGINIVKEHANHLLSGILSVIDFNSNP